VCAKRSKKNGRLPEKVDGSIMAIVSLGGVMGAYDDGEFAFLKTEKKLLVDAVGKGIPVLGICLGCQMLADALGGRAFPAKSFEVGYPQVKLTDAGRADPLIGKLPDPPCVLLHHGDTYQLPPNAVLLAETFVPQAFRVGSAVAVQFHPEASYDDLKSWAEPERVQAKYKALGTSAEAVLSEATQKKSEARKTTERFFELWWQEALAIIEKNRQSDPKQT